MTINELNAKAFKLRKDVLDIIYTAKAGHIGGDFSEMEILVSLYYKIMNISPQNTNSPDRDRFVLSKGHSVESLYSILGDRNFFPSEELKTFSKFGSKFIGHPNNKINGVEMNSGSLGHGLPISVGIALAGKLDKKNYRVYTLMGDGELAEGSVWEGVMAAGHYKLNNLTAFVDRNKLQISGTTEEVMNHNDLDKRFESFGWNVISIDGNNIEEILNAIEKTKKVSDKPTIIIANTIKGYGVSFIENNPSWHHKIPTPEEFLHATKELSEREASFL